MSVAYAYRDHNGSLSPGEVGYEVSVPMLASVFFNFGYDFPEGGGSGVCYYQPEHRQGDYSPHSFRGSSSQLKLQYFDTTFGWRNLQNLIDFQGAFQPTSTLGFQGTTSASPGFNMDPVSPPRFRIAYSSGSGPIVSWTALNVGFADTCYLPPSDPQNAAGYFEGTIFLRSTAQPAVVVGQTLPNGAPLAGRNRVQLIS